MRSGQVANRPSDNESSVPEGGNEGADLPRQKHDGACLCDLQIHFALQNGTHKV
jgi:hypothetical protein